MSRLDEALGVPRQHRPRPFGARRSRLTATSHQSRNLRFGISLGKGEPRFCARRPCRRCVAAAVAAASPKTWDQHADHQGGRRNHRGQARYSVRHRATDDPSDHYRITKFPHEGVADAFCRSLPRQANHLNVRMETRPAHLEWLNGLNAEGVLKIGGPFLDDNGKPCAPCCS